MLMHDGVGVVKIALKVAVAVDDGDDGFAVVMELIAVVVATVNDEVVGRRYGKDQLPLQ